MKVKGYLWAVYLFLWFFSSVLQKEDTVWVRRFVRGSLAYEQARLLIKKILVVAPQNTYNENLTRGQQTMVQGQIT